MTVLPDSAAPPTVPYICEIDFDISVFENLVAEIGREDSLQTFSIFFSEADSRLKRLRALSCEAERKTVEQEAHGLKGSAANFGLAHVAELAATLEKAAHKITARDYGAAVLLLEKRYAVAKDCFARLTAERVVP